EALRLVVKKTMEKRELFLSNIRLQGQLEKKYTFENIIGTSEAMMVVFKTINSIKNSKATILIHGETGTGKELVARAIHFNSDKASKPYLPVNCAALSENLLASELFGHVKGAFTGAIADKTGLFEAASGGTIFLDEIGDIGTGLQQTFLRALENGEIQQVGSFERKKVWVRIIAATNKNLEKMVEQGSFRKDLYYRLNVVIIDLPPLRDRKEDIGILAYHFLKQYSAQNNKNITHISQEALRLLENYNWPGNVRELENIIERATLFEISNEITVDSLPPVLTMPPLVSDKEPSSKDVKSLEQLSKKHIINVLEMTDQNKTQASKLLGIDRSTLWRIMNRLKMN
ncbi:MAG: sigma-54-dependent Fis family transcriptional regulator, partial [Desulfobacteraceae bacterium]|nr:sigma-54-dependent Fis family transcriptional regulator [Desulfobacteraceae bacterium]